MTQQSQRSQRSARRQHNISENDIEDRLKELKLRKVQEQKRAKAKVAIRTQSILFEQCLQAVNGKTAELLHELIDSVTEKHIGTTAYQKILSLGQQQQKYDLTKLNNQLINIKFRDTNISTE